MNSLKHKLGKVLSLGLASLGISALLASASSRQTLRELNGISQPSRLLELGSAADGFLKDVLVERGDILREGDIVATLDFGIEEVDARLAHARAESVANQEMAKARHGFSKRRLLRMEQLAGDHVVSKDQLDAAQTEVELDRLAIVDAEEKIRFACLQLERARAILDRAVIRSPVTGVVKERLMSAGEYLSRSRRGEIAILAQLNPLRIQVHAPLEFRERVRVGDQAGVLFDDPQISVAAGQVVIVDPIMDTASGTFQIHLEIPNPDLTIPAGMRCRVQLRP
jgi:RND family efflux transporter MFP subunit